MTFIKDKNGQWAHPGKNTLIPDAGGRITMRGVNQPVLGIDDLGNQTIMMPGGEYQFPGNDVYEIPLPKFQGNPGKASEVILKTGKIIKDTKDLGFGALPNLRSIGNSYCCDSTSVDYLRTLLLLCKLQNV